MTDNIIALEGRGATVGSERGPSKSALSNEPNASNAAEQNLQTSCLARVSPPRSACMLPKLAKVSAKRDAEWALSRQHWREATPVDEQMSYVQRMAPQVVEMAEKAAGLDPMSSLICLARAGDLAHDVLACARGEA